MKDTLLKFGLKCSLFISAFLAINYFLYILIEAKIPLLTGQKMYWNMSIKNQDFTYVVLGSSRALNNINIVQLDSISATNGLNLSHPGSGLIDNYITLKQFLENGNSAQALYLQIDMYALNSDSSFSYPFHDYLFLPFINSNQEIKEIVMQNSRFKSNKELWTYIPFSRYMEFNGQFNLQFILTGLPSHKNTWDSAKGSELKYRENFKENMELKEKHYGYTSNDSLFLTKIIHLAQENNIKVILFTAPIYHELIQYYDLKQYNYFISAYTKQKNIPYYNFLGDPMNYNKEYFMDYTHLNEKGVRLFSKKISALLAQKP